MKLEDHVAIVTGAGTGIGKAIALEFARHDMSVVCCGRRIELVTETVAQIIKEGGKGLGLQIDVTSAADVERLMQIIMEKFGRLDVLVNNAAAFNAIGPIWEIYSDVWWDDVTTNLRGPMLTMQASLKIMMPQNRGIIINMMGGGAVTSLPGGSGYGSSKAALLGLTQTVAQELEQVASKVTVVGMGPGLVHTEMTQLQIGAEEGRKWIPSTLENFEKGTMRPPEDCARDLIELLRWINPSFNGRIFNVGMNFETIAKNEAS